MCNVKHISLIRPNGNQIISDDGHCVIVDRKPRKPGMCITRRIDLTDFVSVSMRIIAHLTRERCLT